MKCPMCDRSLVLTERDGVELDYCPACDGMWLTGDQLEQLLERARTTDLDAEPDVFESEARHEIPI
jgi:uncharacterized protein